MKRNILFLAMAIASLAGCTVSRVTSEQLAEQKAIYERETEAIIKSDGATLVDKDLADITSADVDKNGYVTMVAWKGGQAARDYYSQPGKTDTLDSKYLTWVTKVNQMSSMADQLHLDKLAGQALALRLEQLLGLPPSADTTRMFMVLQVKPEDLFRPCRDPEINDCSCIPTFPEGAYGPTNEGYLPVYESIIASTKGFPWTRLGYTFDWNSKNRTHFGMSEYVIRQGAIVKIESKTPTEEWIRKL